MKSIDITKIIFYLCSSAVLCVWISTCNLDAATVSECKSACKSISSHMKSVNSRECLCADGLAEDPWVLPR